MPRTETRQSEAIDIVKRAFAELEPSRRCDILDVFRGGSDADWRAELRPESELVPRFYVQISLDSGLDDAIARVKREITEHFLRHHADDRASG